MRSQNDFINIPQNKAEQSRNVRCSSAKATLENPQNDLSESGCMGVARRVSHHQALAWAPHKRCSLSRFTRPQVKIYHLCVRNRTFHIDLVNCKTCLFSDSFGMPQTVCESSWWMLVQVGVADYSTNCNACHVAKNIEQFGNIFFTNDLAFFIAHHLSFQSFKLNSSYDEKKAVLVKPCKWLDVVFSCDLRSWEMCWFSK